MSKQSPAQHPKHTGRQGPTLPGSIVAATYGVVQNLYSTLPYRYNRGGYAFPAWHYYIEMTRRCNLRCKMCQYIDWLEKTPVRDQKVGELDTRAWGAVVDQLPGLSIVTFTGGEVFVRKDFEEIFSRASARARTHFISNATMLPPDRAETLVKLSPRLIGGRGFNFAGTSIEGPEEVHDQIRRLDGAFRRTLAGIRALAEARRLSGKQAPMIHVTTVIQEGNVHVLEFLPRVLKQAGADVMNLAIEYRGMDVPGMGTADPRSFNKSDVPFPRIDSGLLDSALNAVVAEADRAGIKLRLPRMPWGDILNYYAGGIDLSKYQCKNAWNTLFLDFRGDAYSCWLKKVGNVQEQSLRELWNGATMRSFRRECRKELFAPCAGCCFLESKR